MPFRIFIFILAAILFGAIIHLSKGLVPTRLERLQDKLQGLKPTCGLELVAYYSNSSLLTFKSELLCFIKYGRWPHTCETHDFVLLKSEGKLFTVTCITSGQDVISISVDDDAPPCLTKVIFSAN